MKCLPLSKIALANGRILHDWHAEVLAIRAFNHFVLQECKSLLAQDAPSSCTPYIRRSTEADDPQGRPFTWRDDVSLHMYCSEAPCGDASMELIMDAQPDASPWETPLSARMMERSGLATAAAAAPELMMLGRACFSRLGVVRRKPARPDAPPTLSKSCSDKLALKQCTSLLGAAASLLVAPRAAYLASLVLPQDQFSAAACRRCFSPLGRMAAVVVDGSGGGWGGGYVFRPFEVRTTAVEFGFSRRGGPEGTRYVASSLATAWTANGLAENIIGGVLQGRKQMDPRGGSKLDRQWIWHLAVEVAEGVGMPEAVPADGTYEEMKEAEVLSVRRKVNEDVKAQALKGWVRNAGDEGHVLDL